MSETKQIKVSEVLHLLEEGKTRQEVGEHYQITDKELLFLFKHPSLKGMRTKKVQEVSFEILDDTSVIEEEDRGYNKDNERVLEQETLEQELV